ncbi:hypothetical protein DFQ27_007525 [Actinomortierella ambigua]|uniref:F-box domain-containing protein n=1 Tax=Actinomortierella ambigua TaxID=1343610 RepID=A0A9P6TZI1_9FUNG|nr:hypothetical protein DFQ27_007525 [Actinomortierella ambigua]
MPALVLPHQQPVQLPASSSSTRRRSSVLLDKHVTARRRSSLALPSVPCHVLSAGKRPAFLEVSEIADQIAGYLDPRSLCSTARVSRQWHAISLRHLWRETHLDRSVPSKEGVQLIHFPTLSGFIRHLTLSGYNNPTRYPLSLAAPETLHLHSLTIEGCSELDAEALYNILDNSVNHLGHLQLLDVSCLQSNPFALSPSSSNTFKNLEQLRLVRAEGGTPALTTTLTDEVLTQSGEEQAVTTVTSIAPFTDHLIDFLRRAPALKSLTAQGIKEHGDNVEPSVISLATRPHLSLTYLDLHDSTVSGATFGRLLATCPNLVSVNLNHTNDTHFMAGMVIPKGTTALHIKTLSLHGCHFTDGHGFKELFRFASHVEKLNLACSNVDDEALAVLGHSMVGILLDLSLQGCHQITDEGIRELLAHRLGDSLQHLDIAECTELTGRGIHSVLRSCSRLVSLDISQPDILPLSMLHLEHVDEDDEDGSEGVDVQQEQEQQEVAGQHVAPLPTIADSDTALATLEAVHVPWACKDTLEWLRITKLDALERRHLQMLNEHLCDLVHLRALHIGGSKLELCVLNGLGQHSVLLRQLFIDDLAREVTMEDLPYLMTENTPHLDRLWCRHLVRYSEPWSKLRQERKSIKLW